VTQFFASQHHKQAQSIADHTKGAFDQLHSHLLKDTRTSNINYLPQVLCKRQDHISRNRTLNRSYIPLRGPSGLNDKLVRAIKETLKKNQISGLSVKPPFNGWRKEALSAAIAKELVALLWAQDLEDIDIQPPTQPKGLAALDRNDRRGRLPRYDREDYCTHFQGKAELATQSIELRLKNFDAFDDQKTTNTSWWHGRASHQFDHGLQRQVEHVNKELDLDQVKAAVRQGFITGLEKIKLWEMSEKIEAKDPNGQRRQALALGLGLSELEKRNQGIDEKTLPPEKIADRVKEAQWIGQQKLAAWQKTGQLSNVLSLLN